MRTLVSFAALFLSVCLLQLSSGAVGPLDALSGLAEGFSADQIGLLGSAHFAGFFAGCWWAPRLMGTVGHSRAFATFTAFGAMGLLGHTLHTGPYYWAGLRLASGICIAGCYTVIEAWLHARLTNETRGRTMGAYRVVDMGASLMGQLMIGVLATIETYLAYNTLTLMACAALLPLMLTRAEQPPTPAAPRLRPGLAWACSPLAVVGVLTAAVTGASFRMVGPLYGEGVGLSPGEIGVLLAAWVGGGALAQLPAGMLADRYDRRRVLVGMSVASVAGCALMIWLPGVGPYGVLVSAVLFGFATFPLYSVSAAHAYDFAGDGQQVELSAALMFWYAVGAIAAPLVASRLIAVFGPPALFWFIALAHVVLAVYGLARMRVRATPRERTGYVYVPRTTFIIGRLLRRQRSRE